MEYKPRFALQVCWLTLKPHNPEKKSFHLIFLANRKLFLRNPWLISQQTVISFQAELATRLNLNQVEGDIAGFNTNKFLIIQIG